MKAAVIQSKNKALIKTVPDPMTSPTEVLVKVQTCGVCATDVHIYLGELFPNYPLVPGHEFCGIVEAVGEEVAHLRTGDYVAVDPSVFCEACHFCNRNQQNHCEHWNGIGTTRPGGFSEYVAVPAKNAFKFKDLSFAEAALAEPLACVVYGQERARIPLGASVLIFGAGPIGALHLLTAKVNGAAEVVITDIREDKLVLMQQLGATETIISDGSLRNRLQQLAPYGFDVVIDATGAAEVIQGALQYVKNDGTFLLFGVCAPQDRIEWSPFQIYRRDITIVGSFAIKKTYEPALRLLESGALNAMPLVLETFSLDEFPLALETVHQGRARMKVQVEPWG